MYYILDFYNHGFVALDSEDEALEWIVQMRNNGCSLENFEIIGPCDETIRTDALSFLTAIHTKSSKPLNPASLITDSY